ncbi:MAG: caspase family protein [Rubrivivax sp.]|nr:caspase family protein [Rubrivivax sp.]
MTRLGAGGPCAARAQAAGTAAASSPVARMALVVGNQRYALAPLRNAVSDAHAIGAALADCGFTVDLLADATRSRMLDALERFGRALQGRQAVALLYFAGHGLQLDWRNDMRAVDATIASAAEVPAQSLEVQQVLDRFRAAGTRMNIVILDACRGNPFPARTGGAQGLAPMDAPPGSLLAYATAPGNVAEDGGGADANGPYARHLARELARGRVMRSDAEFRWAPHPLHRTPGAVTSSGSARVVAEQLRHR